MGPLHNKNIAPLGQSSVIKKKKKNSKILQILQYNFYKLLR